MKKHPINTEDASIEYQLAWWSSVVLHYKECIDPECELCASFIDFDKQYDAAVPDRVIPVLY